jgi:EAL domain-containing protein (putative c-di-GMP-specific phosphodiesterase class I)/DNA-binding NarL/FixJ family response regulator/GGDEF domain-containing protein
VIEDDPDYRNLLQRFLGKAFPDAAVDLYDPEAKGRPNAGFDWSSYDVLLLDYRLGGGENGLDWLRQFKKSCDKFPATILLTAAGSEEVAVGALRFGAHDYLKKQQINAKRLAESINDAFNVRAQEADISRSLTINASRFSKSYFYGQFDLAFDEAEKGEQRALILIKIDGYDSLQNSLGVLATDEFARILANAGTELFRVSKYAPRATRFTDASIAFIVGGYDGEAGLEDLIARLTKRVETSPPLINGSTVPVTVSVGAVPIRSRECGVPGLLEQANSAAAEAETREGNSYVIAGPGATTKSKSGAVERKDLFDARSAMRENRIQAMFRPVTDISGRSAVLGFEEFFEVCPRFIELTGNGLPCEPILTELADVTLSRVVDRWKIRECVSRLLSGRIPDDLLPGFLIRLGEPSYSDVNLSRWIGELIRYYGTKKGFGELVLSVEPDVLMRNTKPVVALMQHLKSKYAFRFALDGVEDPALCKVCVSNYPFDIVALTDALAQKLIASGAEIEAFERLVSVKGDALMLARGVENADGLHGLISAGVDLVQGDFIAAEQEEVEAAVGIESVSLGGHG